MNKLGLKSMSNFLRANNISFTCITSTANIFYLTGFYCEPHERFLGLFVFPETEPVLVCPKMEFNMAKESGWKKEIIGYSDTESPWKMIQDKLTKQVGRSNRIAVEEEHISLARYKQLTNTLPSIEVIGIDDLLSEMRVYKNQFEIEKMTKAANITDLAIEAGVDSLKEGISEIEVLAIIENKIKENGVTKLPFDPVVLFGKKTADPHGKPDETKLKKGDFVLFDIGAIYEGYCSDITRTFIFKNATEKQKEIYNTVLKANLAGIDMCRIGEKFAGIDKAARKEIEQVGYGEYFIHRTGHGLGIEVHEAPYLHNENQNIVKEGMAVTVEPGIYLEDLGGVRIEDDVVITASGPKVLTKYPKELHVLQ